MPVRSAPQLPFFVFAALHVAGLCDDRLRVPWTGTLALAALLGYVLATAPIPGAPAIAGTPIAGTRLPRPSHTRPMLVAGLVALTAAAGLAESRPAGWNWPLAATEPVWPWPRGMVEALLHCLAVAFLAVAVLRAAGPPRSRSRLVGLAAVAGLLGSAALLAVYTQSVTRYPWSVPAGVARFVLASPVLVGTAVLGTFAAGAAWLSRRRLRAAGAGLALLAFLAFLAVDAVADDALRWSAPVETRVEMHAYLLPARDITADEATIIIRSRLSEIRQGSGPVGERPAVAQATAIDVSRTGPGAGSGGPWPADVWAADVWAAETSWPDSLPALSTALLLLGLVSLAVGVLAREEQA